MEISDKKEVFCRYIRKNGRIIYPKNAKFFHFWVNETTCGETDSNSSESLNDLNNE